jgi:hypothetical protein
LLESIENFLKRLDIYTKIPPTPAMDEILVKIMVELISTFALATAELKQGRPSEYFLFFPFSLTCFFTRCNAEKFVKQLFGGGKDAEDILQRLDRLTLDEAKTTGAEILKVVHSLVQDMSKQTYSTYFSLVLNILLARWQSIW